MPGLYVHIPFCRKACAYCDFHFSTNTSRVAEMLDSIGLEAVHKKNYFSEQVFSSLYLGGGTPSLCGNQVISKLIFILRDIYQFESSSEFTLEANPDDIDNRFLKDLLQTGFNRLSIGLQSFNDEELKWMNRAHNAAQSLESVKMAQDAGFGNITIDLIYGSRFQTLQSWEKTLERALELNVQHISAYNLTVEHKTLLGHRVQKGLEPAVDEEKSSRQFLLMSEMLETNGFVHYEISNFAKPGKMAVHNSNYWLGKTYIGLGPSAHSFNGETRQFNVKNNEIYMRNIASGTDYFEVERLTPENRYNEYVLTRLRTIWGCDVSEIENLFGKHAAIHFENEIRKKLQFVEEKNGVYTLNKQGRLMADGIAADLFL